MNVTRHLLKHPALTLTLVLSVVYAAGFLVSNAHLASYEVLGFDLIRIRFFTAGALFLVLTAIPTSVMILWLRELRTHPRFLSSLKVLSPTRVVLAWAINIVLGVALSWGAWSFALLRLSVDPMYQLSWRAFVYFAAAVFLSAAALYMPGWNLRESNFVGSVHRLNPTRAWDIAYYSLALVALTTSFGVLVYPSLRPAYGGGGAWQGSIVLNANSNVPHLGTDGDSALLILNRDGGYVRFLVCAGDRPRGIRAFEVSRASVFAMEVLGQQSVDQFRSHCRARSHPEQAQ